VAFVRRCLKGARDEGRLTKDADVEVLAWMVTGAMRGAARTRRSPTEAWRSVEAALFKRRGKKRKAGS
jgi:hypothetical protein